MTLRDELPRSVPALYATGEAWRNSSRKNEEMEPKWKQQPVVDVTGDGSKVMTNLDSLLKIKDNYVKFKNKIK